MTLQDLFRILRTRWLTICLTVLIAVLGAVALTWLTTPLYQASTRLFVSTTTGGATVTETYQGNRLSQERVLSYTELLMGQTIAQRTIDKLGLSMSVKDLQSNVKATAKPETVLIDVKVVDPSPERARDLADALSDEFVAMVRDLETPEDGGRPDARVVVEQRALLPEAPIVPKSRRNLALGLGLGLAVGICLAIFREVMDNTVKDQTNLEELTGVGMVGAIPLDKARRNMPAISFDVDHSAIAEAYRKLRTNLQFLSVDTPPRVILVASSVPEEAKSTTAINLALALAEGEHNVVLLEADLRRPELASYLNLVGSVGFSTVLSGQAALSDVLQSTRYPRLTALTSGNLPPNPSELLGTAAAQSVLADLREKFDYVIIDSSPLLAVTDAAILAAKSDAVLITTRYGKTKRQQVLDAINSLRDVNAPLLGCVLTMTPSRGNGYDAYQSYGHRDKARDAKRTAPVSTTRPIVSRHVSVDTNHEH